MNNGYGAYIIVEIFLIIFTLSIHMNIGNSVGSEYEIKKLKNIIYTYWAAITFDIFATIDVGNIFPFTNTSRAVINALSMGMVLLGCYIWFKFVFARLKKYIGNKEKKIAIAVPFIITFSLDIISIFTGWIFYIDEFGKYQYGNLFFIHQLCCLFYLGVPAVYSIKAITDKTSKTNNIEYIMYVSYMIFAVIAAMFEDAFEYVPLFYLSMYMIIHTMFVFIQHSQIFNDALTGLNNRRKMNEYILSRIEESSPQKPLTVFMIDIDKFKHINDTFGHIEGDNAIKIVSRAIAMTAGKFNGFAARYGGDEFCFILNKNNVSQEDVKNYMRSSLDELMKNNKDYSLSISIGCCVCATPNMRPDKIIEIADEQLYLDKKRER